MKQLKSIQGMSEAEVKFWERYAELLNKDGVTGKKGSFLILRAQEFAYSLGGKRLKAVEERDVELWLEELGRNSHFESWQLLQAHKAVHFLITRMLPDSEVPSIDWSRLREPFADQAEFLYQKMNLKKAVGF